DGHLARRHSIDQPEHRAHRLAATRDLVVAETGLATRARELRAHVRELRLACAEVGSEASIGALRLSHRATEQRLIAGVGDRERGLTRDETHPRELAWTERTATNAIVEVHDAEDVTPSDEWYGEDASQPERVDRGMEIAHLRERVGRTDR